MPMLSRHLPLPKLPWANPGRPSRSLGRPIASEDDPTIRRNRSHVRLAIHAVFATKTKIHGMIRMKPCLRSSRRAVDAGKEPFEQSNADLTSEPVGQEIESVFRPGQLDVRDAVTRLTQRTSCFASELREHEMI